MNEARQLLTILLRGNHGIQSKSSLDICEVEVIGMKIGKEIFELLRTVVLLQTEGGFEFMNIFGGPQYFKVQDFRDNTYQVSN
jgi:hypothetical protein